MLNVNDNVRLGAASRIKHPQAVVWTSLQSFRFSVMHARPFRLTLLVSPQYPSQTIQLSNLYSPKAKITHLKFFTKNINTWHFVPFYFRVYALQDQDLTMHIPLVAYSHLRVSPAVLRASTLINLKHDSLNRLAHKWTNGNGIMPALDVT
jgi:hypothetical protein